LFLFQVVGINGAFLTGDLFNLFVFFEILLIASYALLVHGGGREKTKAGFHYVTLNLIGSALFLVALGTLYGTMGSLNMADMSAKVGLLLPEDQILAKTGGLLLLLVFSLKAALLPLHFWLPKTYAAGSASVVALFAVMTKVGFYAICRVFGGIFGSNAGALANFAIPWIWPLAIATIALGSIGVYAATSLRLLTANMVIVSVGTLLITFAMEGGQSLRAGFFYLLHSTAVTGALFLIADQVGSRRGAAMDRFVKARPVTHATVLGGLFLVAAIAAVGLPPLSGFIGKVMILHSASRFAEQVWVWPALLTSSLVIMIAFSRAGSTFFWHVSDKEAVVDLEVRGKQIAAIFILLSATALMTVFADSILVYCQDAAGDLRQNSTAIQHHIEAQELRS
jgi:multicomponent K+:H+ antiporter subunit D